MVYCSAVLLHPVHRSTVALSIHLIRAAVKLYHWYCRSGAGKKPTCNSQHFFT